MIYLPIFAGKKKHQIIPAQGRPIHAPSHSEALEVARLMFPEREVAGVARIEQRPNHRDQPRDCHDEEHCLWEHCPWL